MSSITFKIYTLGCKVNLYDSGILKSELQAANFKTAPSGADLVFINTCSVTASAIHKNKRMINKAHQENPCAKIILLGCWPKVENDQAAQIGADIVWQSRKYQDLILEVRKLFFNNLTQEIKKSKAGGFSAVDRARYFIKIQDGCEQYCSYCVIPFARGKYQSRKAEEIINEIKSAIGQGYEEFVLSGVHLGRYGCEKESRDKVDLTGLLHKILKIDGLGRIRLSSIEIVEITPELIKLIKNNPQICRHLHIPLQSGMDKILKLMNRPYDLKYFEKKLKDLRQAMPDISVSTDVIVGFPGETDEDFLKTVEFIKTCGFSALHVFSFSAHKRTKAFSMPGQIEKKVIEKRSADLRILGKILENENLTRYKKNKKFRVLIEKETEKGFFGKTEYYFNVNFAKKNVIDWLGHNPNEPLVRKLVEIDSFLK